jgi:hypothetical protein
MMEVFRSQIPFLCFGKAASLKGSHGFNFPRPVVSHVGLPTNIA